VQKATEEIALSIRARVRAQRARELELRSQTSGGVTSAESKARYVQSGSSSSELELEGIETIERYCGAPEEPCYALAVLERAAFVARLRRKHDALQQELERLLALAQTPPNPLENLRAAGQVVPVASNLDDTSSLIAAVGGAGAAPSPALPGAVARRAAAIRRISICFVTSSTELRPNVVFERARAALTGMGISSVAIAAEKSCTSDALAILLDVSWSMRENAELRVATIDGSLSLRVGEKTVGGSRGLVGRGLARDADRARRDAEEQLGKAVALALQDALQPDRGRAVSERPER
jgi:hypothetical protein